MKFIPGGPARFAHQRAGLIRLIETRGVCALLFDAGTGKTATTMDYLSLLALKSNREVGGVREARVLVISPKAAMDTWILQAETYVSPQVNVWAEVLGGSIPERAAAIASRGPRPYRPRAVKRRKDLEQLQHRALNADRAELRYIRGGVGKVRGPNDVREGQRPRLVLLSTNLDTFSSRASVGSKTMADVLLDAVKRYEPDVIVVDELHKIKGHGSNMSRLIARIGDLVPRRIGLTGTVMPKGPMDVFAQWRFIQPRAFGALDPKMGKRERATFTGFQRRFGVLGGYMGREVVSYQNLDELQEIMAENSLVVRKEDALDLPQMTDIVVPITLSSKEEKVYQDMKDDLAARLGGSAAAVVPNKLTQMLRLRQITAGHLPDDTGTVHTVGTSKVDAIHSLVHDTLEGEKRVVVFALFRHEIAALAARLAERGTEVMVIDGNTPDDRRLAMRRKFGDLEKHPDRIVLVAQVQTISLSVNELVTASHAIFATLSQRRDDVSQARDRLNRLGQRLPCTFWYVLARGTIDEVIYRSHQARTDLEAAILSHIQGVDPQSVL